MTPSDPIRAMVEDYLASHDAVISSVAAKEIEATCDPEILGGWLWDHRLEILTTFITRYARMHGAHESRQRRTQIFTEAAAELEAAIEEADGDDTKVMEFYRMWHCGNSEGREVRKCLGEMTKEEVLFVRNRHESNVRYYQRREKFMALIAEPLGEGETVGDRFSPTELEELLASIK